LNNVLISQGFPQDCNYPGGLSTSFLEIFESKQFFCWFSSVLVTELFASPDQVEENGKIFLLRYNQVGGIRFKQYRVKNHSCQALNYTTGLSATTIDCYADYSVAARSEDSYGPYLNSGYNCSGLECQYAQAFQFSNQIPHSYAYTGQISAYDESGFYVDTSSILVNDTLTQTALTDLGTYLQQNSWIDVQTRAVLVTFSFYNINYNYFSGLELLIETSATGYVVPSYKLNTLYLNFYFDSWNQMTDSAYSFFLKVPELYCYVYNILGILVPIIYKLKRRPVEYLKQMWSYIDMILCMLMLGVLIIRIILYYICLAVINSIKEKSFDTSANLSSANFYLSLSWGFESYVVLIASFKVLDYFKIQSMTIIWDTLARGSKSILGFFVVFIVLLCSFTQMANIVYGSQLIDFMNFSRTISSLFLMLLGGLNDYPYMNQVSPYFTPVFFVFYMFLMFFVIMNIFVAILNEAFGVVVEMQIKEHEKEIFGLFVNNLVSEIKLIGGRLKYSCKNCCKKNKVERSVAFKAFNRN
jgi:Polycystin cation channel